VRWLTWWQALGLASPDLRLPLNWRGDVQQYDELVVEAPLRTVAGKDIYAPFLDWAARAGHPFHAFAYDWRRDNLESADKFIEFLETVSEQNGGTKIQVVAHSMGGLISFVALSRRPDLFHSVLFAGVPFGFSISFLEDMHAGTATGLNKRILRPQVLFTFVSPYCFFPTNERKSGLVKPNGERILHDWYSADDWEQQKLGVFGPFEASQPTDEQREHLRRALGRAREFRRLIARKQEESFWYPPIAVLASDTRPTLSTVVWNGPRAVRGWDFHAGTWEPGDGRVEFANAMPPEGVPFTVHKTACEHADLLNDTGQVSSIIEQLCEREHK
jgi:pimeloyl-ACP methyl ester carboxylesterase